MLRRKYLLVRILIYLGSGWIFCTKCNFLLPLRQLIFRQKQPGHWAEVVCHFHLSFNAPTDTYFSFSHFSFLIFLHKAIPVSKSSIICKFLIYKTFIGFVKASKTNFSKRGCCFDNPFVWWATQKFIFSNISNVKSSKDYKTLKFRNCLKTGQLNRLNNHLIYKAFIETVQASSIELERTGKDLEMSQKSKICKMKFAHTEYMLTKMEFR